MKLLGRNRLQALYGRNHPTDTWIRNWICELSRADWMHAKDVLRQFPKARNVADDIFLFPVEQQAQCIEVTMVFTQAVALIVDLKNVQPDGGNGS